MRRSYVTTGFDATAGVVRGSLPAVCDGSRSLVCREDFDLRNLRKVFALVQILVGNPNPEDILNLVEIGE